MGRSLARVTLAALAAAFVLPGPGAAGQDDVPAPAEVYGFEPGTDGRLASWNEIVEYLKRVGVGSERVITEEVGESTEGRPFLLTKTPSPENLARLDRLAEISRGLADPRGRSEAEVDRLVEEGKTVAAVTAGFNPDGTKKVVEWVRETRGTEWEGARYPDPYHHYSGHDKDVDRTQVPDEMNPRSWTCGAAAAASSVIRD
jgi:hypothetical protein